MWLHRCSWRCDLVPFGKTCSEYVSTADELNGVVPCPYVVGAGGSSEHGGWGQRAAADGWKSNQPGGDSRTGQRQPATHGLGRYISAHTHKPLTKIGDTLIHTHTHHLVSIPNSSLSCFWKWKTEHLSPLPGVFLGKTDLTLSITSSDKLVRGWIPIVLQICGLILLQMKADGVWGPLWVGLWTSQWKGKMH